MVDHDLYNSHDLFDRLIMYLIILLLLTLQGEI